MPESNFFENAYQLLNTFRKDGTLCDVVLRTKACSAQYSVHRVILAAQSSYFKAMFTSAMIERDKEEIVLEGVENVALEKIIEYCYTGDVLLSPTDVEDVLDASHMLGLVGLQNLCFEFLRNNMDSSNCYGIAHLAEKYSCSEVRKIAENFALKNFRQLMNSSDFTSLQYDQLLRLISNNRLNVVCEGEVFTAIMRWIKHRPGERCCHMKDLLAYVRFPLLTRKFLIDSVMRENLVLEDKECREYLYNALDYHLVPERRTLAQQEQYSPRTKSTSAIYVVGGENRTGALSSVEAFDMASQSWRNCAELTIARKHPSLVVTGGMVYCMGGIDGEGRDISAVERYDTGSNKWALVASPNKCKGALAAAVLDGWLYAAGGTHNGTALKAVERYDPARDQWKLVQNMRFPRSHFGIGILGNRLFAVGGCCGVSGVEHCEAYDPLTNKWKEIADLNKARMDHGVAVHADRIFVVGGFSHSGILDCIEKYNIGLNMWLIIKHTLDPRTGCSVLVVDTENDEHSLFILGGIDASHCCHSSVKRMNLRSIDYCIGSGKAMKEPRAYGGIVAI